MPGVGTRRLAILEKDMLNQVMRLSYGKVTKQVETLAMAKWRSFTILKACPQTALWCLVSRTRLRMVQQALYVRLQFLTN